MASSKKIISLVLAIAMVIGVFAISAFAVAPAATITLTADSTDPYAIDDIITITVTASASEDFYVGPFGIPVEYDSSKVEFVAATSSVADVFGTGTSDGVINSQTAGRVDIAGWPTTAGTPAAPNLNGQNVVLATLTFKAIANGQDVAFSVANDRKTTANPTGKFYVGSFDNSNPKDPANNLTEVGQTLTVASATVDIGSAEPELILTATGTSNGVIIDTHKTFGGAYAGVVYGFPQATNTTFRSINYITDNLTTTTGALTAANLARTIGTAGYGTGTTITVGSKVYVIVIFGDSNGDGLINNNDITAVKGMVKTASLAPNNSVLRMSANCQQVNNGTMLHTLNNNDLTGLKNYIAKKAGCFTQPSLAATMNNYNNFYQ